MIGTFGAWSGFYSERPIPVITIFSSESVFVSLTRMSKAAVLLFVLLPCISSAQSDLGAVTTSRQPNIVYMMADDLGFADFSPLFMPRSYQIMRDHGVQIPFYTMQNCAPTRAALMTGKHPGDLGITGVDSPPNYAGIALSERMLSEKLKDAGYTTGIFGKWHLGLDRAQSPLNRGFDEFVGFTHGWINYYGTRKNGEPYADGSIGHDHNGAHDFQYNGVPLYAENYSTFIFANAAKQFIRKNSSVGKPFFAYVPFNAPHTPNSAPRRYVTAYQALFDVSESELEYLFEYEGDVLGVPYGLEIDDDVLYKLTDLLFYSSIRALDDAVADIYETLVETGAIENTFFMFASDNGAGIGNGPKRHGSNGSLRGGKGTPYEGGHRVANFIVWPGVLDVDHQVRSNVWVGDLHATFLALAGQTSDEPELESNNMLPAIVDGTLHQLRKNGGRHIITHVSRGTRDGITDSTWAINNAGQKYIRVVSQETATDSILSVTEELYDLVRDPGESTNLVNRSAYKTALQRMRNKYDRYGGDERLLNLHNTRNGGWGEFELPQEWGFPGQIFTEDQILRSDLF